MKQILLPVTLALMLSGCAASLVYDQDRTPRDCGNGDDRQRCPGLTQLDGGYRLAVVR